ncbi:unnamed protein product, partial [Oppiella nova]
MGTTPMVIIGDYNLVKKAFNSKNNELMGRPVSGLRKLLFKCGNDVICANHGPVWASLRRVAHSAVRKLAVSEKLSELVDDVVNETVETMISNEGIGKPFNPKTYIYMSVLNIIASSAFGKRYSFDDKELKFYEKSFQSFRANTNEKALSNYIPFLKRFYSKSVNKTVESFTNLSINLKQKYLDRLKVHSKGEIHDFCDALIEAKEEAIAKEKESALHLNDQNLSLVIMDLFIAGADTTEITMRWIVLLMANNIEMQLRMRHEINDIIGDRVADNHHKNDCHYVNAFIAETLRYRSPAPLGLAHVALCDYQLEKYHISKGSQVFSNLYAISRDPNLWSKPDVFSPNRFLDKDNKYMSALPGFTPFGIGRRICLGERLALA